MNRPCTIVADTDIRRSRSGGVRTGSSSTTARSAGCPGATVDSLEASIASAAVIACSGCHGARPSFARPTAAAIVIHGSSGATGASEPSRNVAPASSSARSAKDLDVRSPQ